MLVAIFVHVIHMDLMYQTMMVNYVYKIVYQML